MINVLLWGAVLSLPFGACYYQVKHPTVCVELDVVKVVGGCNKYGECGVIMKNGTKRIEKYPVVGETICSKERRR